MSAVAIERLEGAPAAAGLLNLIDEQNPWLGLDSFSEETRQYFHGREEEIGELARRVQRKTLSILFGQSGLGKTSILRAGIVPRLRREGYCPVYVRIDYARESPAPSQQIKQAIFRATEGTGKWTRPGSAVPGESLWEFLHHRDDVLQDAEGRTLTPLLIFDQFEEIFTLAQDDDFGRKRVAEFVEDLADLVENRAPKSLELMLESEDAIGERFDFNRADYRILIALREDYLAHLEGLKGRMPSITQNRMRLARMTGTQALVAVTKPGGRLVTDEVAESIVRFVAGGAELRNAEVEPSLLSLVCRELNNARVAQGRDEISADLLAGSRETILHEFYERGLADQPEGVRRFVEDEMLTESGFRESVAEERVLRAFNAAGAAPGALAVLVNRRLLRIEERLDLRRVELTHDVLCKVVAESRDQRHQREAREETERHLAAQKAREVATRKALVRARQVAAGCLVLAVGAIAGALFGYVNMKRAQEAELKAVQTRASAESARGEAEKLIVYLLDDFYQELEPVGRLDIVANLSKRAVDYYAGLPAELRNTDTQRNRALALVRYGYALRNQARLQDAKTALTESVGILDGMHTAGDRSEATLIGLGLGLTGLARVLASQNQLAEAGDRVARGEGLLKAAMGASPSVAMRRTYAQVTNYLGFVQLRSAREEDAVRTLKTSRQTYRGLYESTEDLSAAAAFCETTAWMMEGLSSLGLRAEARATGEEALPLAAQVLQKRPGHMPAIRARALINVGLAEILADDLRIAAAMKFARAAESDWESYVALDPTNTIAWNNLGASRIRIAYGYEQLGQIQEGIKTLRAITAIAERAKLDSGIARNLILPSGRLAELEADAGISSRASTAVSDHRRFATMAVSALPADAPMRTLLLEWGGSFDSWIALASGDYRAAKASVAAAIARIEPLKPNTPGVQRFKDNGMAQSHRILSAAAYNLGDYAEAERAAARAIEHRSQVPVANRFDKFEMSELRILHALALARLGRAEEARAIAESEARRHREWIATGSEDQSQRVMLARALLAAAIATPARSRELLDEANGIMASLPAEMARLRSVAKVRGWIAAERAKRG